MNSEVKVYKRDNGEVQRVQVVRFDDWSKLDFLCTKQEGLEHQLNALHCFYDIYKNYLVPTFPWIFPHMVMFCMPEDAQLVDGEIVFGEAVSEEQKADTVFSSARYGETTDLLTIASIILQNGVKLHGRKPSFYTTEARNLWKELEARDCIRIVCGNFPSTKIIPVGNFVGYLSECETDAQMKVNANFFIMDPFDCATIYDQVGMPFGLCVKDGAILSPPVYNREALVVNKNGNVSIQQYDVRDLEIEIAGVRYRHGENATIYTRPERAKSPKIEGTCIVVVGNRVAAIKKSGPVDIPASGFVMRVDKNSFIKPRTLPNGTPMKECPLCKVDVPYVDAKPGDEVIYHGLQDIQFGIQVGNSIIRDGVKTDRFISRFYNIYHLERVPFPPSLYPMDFEKAQAARIALGADKEGKPVLVWAEGKGKLSYVPGEDSTGASLREMTDIAVDLGLRNAVNLDGGGSAQILLHNQRTLRISDRNKEDNSDAERLIPMGLIYK